jgi:fibronectin type 3 domain-containing protein
MTMRMRTIAILATVFLGLGLGSGCAKDHSLETVVNPRDPELTGIRPPVPTSLRARVSNGSAEISWSFTRADSSFADSVAFYRIYRGEGNATPALSDSTDRPPANLSGLVNGIGYRVAVASVLKNGLEGKRSASLAVVPGVFGLQVDNGRETTRSLSVGLTLLAPVGTRGMQVANGPDLDAAPIQPFASQLAWQIPAGDGEKEIFARFVDAEGNLSLANSARIRLDTRADITSVAFQPNSVAVRPGDTLLFRLETAGGEAHGTARVSLGTGGRQLDLRDDGRAGDATADDGIYALAYTVPPDLALVDVLVTGDFTDEAGNDAPSFPAPVRLTVRNDPPAVTLDPIVSPAPGELYLSWSEVADAGRFSAYRLFRAVTPGVDTSGTRVQVREITARSSTTYTDTGLDPNRTYYYRVTVVDPNGRTSSSNEEAGRPRLAASLDPVTLDVPSNVTETSVSLSFSRCLAPTFAQYRILRGEHRNLDTDPERRLLTTITSAGTTTYDDRTELEQGMSYYYRVDAVDGNGTASPSNTVSATIPDLPPAAVTLNAPTSTGETAVLLSWTQSDIRDFQRYELRRASAAGVGPEADSLASFDQKESVSYLDAGLTENTKYFYRIFVIDKGGNRAGSNELKVTTANADPDPVELFVPTEDTNAFTPSVTSSWAVSLAHDFAEYRLYRDTAPAVGETSTLVRTIADSMVVSYLDAGLSDNTRYYYRVFVRDDAGGKAGSNEQSVVTANRPPTPVTLSVSGTTANSISVNWTQNNDHDFNEYRLLKGTTSTTFPTTVVSFTQKTQVSHTLFVATADTTRYFFKVVVYDKELGSTTDDLSTDSNVVSARAVKN